jgi:hypothetical protein
MDRNVKDSSNSENTLAGYQRHSRHRSRLQQLALVVVIYGSRAVQIYLELIFSTPGRAKSPGSAQSRVQSCNFR